MKKIFAAVALTVVSISAQAEVKVQDWVVKNEFMNTATITDTSVNVLTIGYFTRTSISFMIGEDDSWCSRLVDTNGSATTIKVDGQAIKATSGCKGGRRITTINTSAGLRHILRSFANKLSVNIDGVVYSAKGFRKASSIAKNNVAI